MKKLARIMDCYGRFYYIAWDDLQGTRTQLPLYCKTGRKVADLPKAFRPDAVTIHRENIEAIATN